MKNKSLKYNHEQISWHMPVRSRIQVLMNNTRDMLNMGKFNPGKFKKVNLTVKNKKIAREFDNYTIVHITDIHIGQWLNKQKLDRVVGIINNMHPDLVVITGDYLSYHIKDEYLEQLTESLEEIRAKDKVLSVLGNHDHWTDAGKIKQALKNAGIINLENEIYRIRRNNKTLQIAGADSVTVGKDDIEKIKEKLDYNSPAIMLVHEPDFADITAQINPFILQLSGHSHGGQFEIPLIRTPVRGRNFRKYPLGRYDVGNLVQYTNRGIGTNAFWFRINSFYEITRITLKTE